MCDHSLFLWLNFDGGQTMDQIMYLISGKLTWIPLYLLIIYMLFRRIGWKQTLLAVVFIALIVVVSDQIANIFKTYTPRFRPTHTPQLEGLVHTVNNYMGGFYGTVSAHAATTMGIATFTAGLIRSRLYTSLIILWSLLVSYSRIYLGVHFPFDIMYGTILGIVCGITALMLYRRSLIRLRI